MKNHSNIHNTSHIEGDIQIDESSLIGPNCFLKGNISIGANSKIKGGVTFIGDIDIAQNSIIEPGVSIASQNINSEEKEKKIIIGSNSFVGAGSVLHPGIVIGDHTRVDAGSVLMRNIPSYAIVRGSPSAIAGYMKDISYKEPKPQLISESHKEEDLYLCKVQGVTIHNFIRIKDIRGDLIVGEFNKNIPFLPKRYFIVLDVPSSETRGEHAHKSCHQFLICTSGRVSVIVDDGKLREEIVLDRPNMGLFIPAGIWGVQYKYSSEATLLVFASDYYDTEDYIRDYDEFISFRKELE